MKTTIGKPMLENVGRAVVAVLIVVLTAVLLISTAKRIIFVNKGVSLFRTVPLEPSPNLLLTLLERCGEPLEILTIERRILYRCGQFWPGTTIYEVSGSNVQKITICLDEDTGWSIYYAIASGTVENNFGKSDKQCNILWEYTIN
ncbi:MAG: hypothetical protein WAO55_06990 [Candidatus Manganitrophaceae bacterium]